MRAGVRAPLLPSGIRPPADPKGPPLYFFRYPFLVTDPKIFLKALINNNFEGGARAEKNAIFWSKFSKKCLKMPFLAYFFKILPTAHKFWPKQGLWSVLESSENQFGWPKKRATNCFLRDIVLFLRLCQKLLFFFINHDWWLAKILTANCTDICCISKFKYLN